MLTVWRQVACRGTNKTPDTVGHFFRMTADSDLLSHTGFPCSAWFTAPLRGAGVGFAADGTAWLTARVQVACRVQTKTPDTVGRFCSYYCRQRPTLPHSFPCSTIGGSRLNFRVRNGNGCDPAPMTTGKLVCLGSRLRSLRELRRTSAMRLAQRSAVRREGGSSQTISKSTRRAAGCNGIFCKR